MLRPTALALLTSLALAGCKLGLKETPLPETSILIDSVPVVENSTRSPCWQQRQIAVQRSYLDTIRTKKETVYAAPCDVDPPHRKPAQKVAANG